MCDEMFLVPGEGQHLSSDPEGYGDGAVVLKESLMLQDDRTQA